MCRDRSGPGAGAAGRRSPRPTPGRLGAELERLQRIPLLTVDEISYIPFERQAANLLFALVARRYERGSIIVTSNFGFEAWGEILGDPRRRRALRAG